MPQPKQSPDQKPGSTLLKLTKMIERKTKDTEVGDLIHYSFHDQGSVWIVARNIAALFEGSDRTATGVLKGKTSGRRTR